MEIEYPSEYKKSRDLIKSYPFTVTGINQEITFKAKLNILKKELASIISPLNFRISNMKKVARLKKNWKVNLVLNLKIQIFPRRST